MKERFKDNLELVALFSLFCVSLLGVNPNV
jgi:hypothetical protein